MSKVFFGGSRKVGRLNSALRTRLRNLITNRHTILIGDANGADKAAQAFFAEEAYRDVVVYCMDGECRNNVGDWPVETVLSEGKKRDFAYFALKDARMSLAAEHGFMIWDGESKGTLNNVLNLLQQAKPVLLYLSPSKQFLNLRSVSDLDSILAGCDAETLAYLNKRIALDKRLSASNQASLDL